MTIKTQYFLLPARSNTDSSLLIKFDGQYSYWGSTSHTWISDPFLKQIDNKFKPITESDANRFIKTGVPPTPGYQRLNPKLDGIIL